MKTPIVLFSLCIFLLLPLCSDDTKEAEVSEQEYQDYQKNDNIEALKELSLSLLRKSDYKQTIVSN